MAKNIFSYVGDGEQVVFIATYNILFFAWLIDYYKMILNKMIHKWVSWKLRMGEGVLYKQPTTFALMMRTLPQNFHWQSIL